MTTYLIFNPKETEREWNFKVGAGERAKILYANISDKISAHRINVELLGEGAEAEIYGLFLLLGDAKLDLGTHQNHKAANTRSRLLVKSALGGRSTGSYKGLITMKKKAAKSDAYQENRNLILGEQARADSNPFLEILASDVKCSHGASTSPLSSDSLFYLMTRGLSEADSKKLLTRGFFRPVISQFENKIGGELDVALERFLNAQNFYEK